MDAANSNDFELKGIIRDAEALQAKYPGNPEIAAFVLDAKAKLESRREAVAELIAQRKQQCSRGKSIKIAGYKCHTPKHKFLTVRKGQFRWIKAKNLRRGDVVLTASRIE